MEVKAAIRARRSIRRYEKRPIPKDVLEDLLDSARLSPSSNNMQRYSIVVVTDDEIKEKLVPVSGNQKFVGSCSAFLVGVTEPGAYYSTVDMTIALDHLSLHAVELGLGTCWIGDFEPEKVKEILSIPEDRDVPICMTLGYPAIAPGAKMRKGMSELFHRDRWGNRWD
jgi:nitroreductase